MTRVAVAWLTMLMYALHDNAWLNFGRTASAWQSGHDSR
jgi:hypothetical protein